MEKLSQAAQDLLAKRVLGVATTLRRDGSPHSTVVWAEALGGDAAFNTAWPRAKPRHLERDPRVTLLAVDPDDDYRWVAVSGRAHLTEEGANEQIDRLSEKYRGVTPYRSHRPGETRVTVRIEAERIVEYGLG